MFKPENKAAEIPERTAIKGMTKRHPHENQHRKAFTLLACPVYWHALSVRR
jgi:hypothetical protein